MASIPLTFRWPVAFCLSSTTTTYLLSLVTGNVSQVDRVWTFLPVIYTAYYALLPFWPNKLPIPLFPYAPEGLHRTLVNKGNPRTSLMLGLQFIWMCRLSYNTWRRGLFNLKDEDYRWEVLRAKIPPWLFQVFNISFIAIIQNILLFLLAIPTHNAAILPPADRALKPSDYVLALLSLATLAVEFVADNQQFSFQTHKRTGVHKSNEWPGARLHWTQADVQRGFLTRGLWAWSRHPNFACEQTFWILQALFPVFAMPSLEKLAQGNITPLITLVPPLALCTLFLSSTLFTEAISESKYPVAYRAYRNRVAMFIPLLTPLWGWFLHLQGKKEYCDRLVFGGVDMKKQ
ncbi:hypothetical protein EW145_g1013 [Phellinidium pouzarii]|uniref:Steroid 5-alpha reductase C-terminal domain-containing protein n=1 Tax=Phellinidium pouzarii TaxID=167371 RepID=A0A4S4LLJ2_9AGAM|nr:hypothetical protein EW145_g1013 [Phellinidium pouzarii]